MTKPNIKPNEIAWFQAYERMKSLPKGTKLRAQGMTFKLDHVFGDPHPPSVLLKLKQGRNTVEIMVRRGNQLLTELQG